jgi:hypothetical protein
VLQEDMQVARFESVSRCRSELRQAGLLIRVPRAAAQRQVLIVIARGN